jgi:hypothetical protein
MSRCWKDGDKLIFTHPVTRVKTNGIMRGYATTELADIGRGLIVEIEDGFDFNGGRFNHMIVMEAWVIVQMEKVNP